MNEQDIGMEVFLTKDVPGIGGKLRKRVEDFVVEEVPLPPPPDAEGKYVVAKVRHRNWEANRLVKRMASNLRVGRGRVAFAGTKDGRSVATQMMSFDAAIEDVRALAIPDVEILDTYTSKRMIEIGNLIGNRFDILISDVERDDAPDLCGQVSGQLARVGGFPNFFGVQRFGSIRPITHEIGRRLVLGDFEGAIMTYVANPMGDEEDEANIARRNLQESGDFERALNEFPRALTFELVLIRHLRARPEDYAGALRCLPRNLLMMFVHAYQSFLFNRILSERVRTGLPLDVPLEGDLVLPLDKNGLPDHDNPIMVTLENIDKATRNAKEGKAFVSGLLFGTESSFSKGPMGEIERKIVESEKLANADFQIVGLREASSKGTRRELLAPFRGLETSFGDDASARFRFELNKGCYATALLREFMKADATRY